MNYLDSLLVFAQAQGGAQGGAAGGIGGMLFMIVPMFAIMYFLMIRPQQKKQKEHDQMLQAIKAGDKVMTSCGIFGKVVKVVDKHVVIEVADRVQIDFLTDAVAQVINDMPTDSGK